MGQSWSQTTFTWDEGPTEDRINPISTVISTIDGKSLRLTSKIDIGVYHSSFFAAPKTGTSDIFVLGYTADTLLITVDANNDSIYGDPFTLNSVLMGEFGNGTSTVLSLIPNGDNSEIENYLDDNASTYQSYSPANPANFTHITSLEIINGNASGAHFIIDDILATIPDFNTVPTATSNTLAVEEDTLLAIQTSDLGYNDADGDELNYIFIVDIPASGTLFLDADGDRYYDLGEEVNKRDQISKSDLDSNRLLFQPVPQEFGLNYASFEFAVHDGKSYAESSHLITFDVDAINDEPSFTKGEDQTVLEDAGMQSIAGWATSLDKGTAEESAQTLIFSLSNDNNGLFSVQPAIDTSGTLTYTPALHANGVALVNVILQDDGGTDNGGDDTYDTQTFSITVTSVNDAPSFSMGANETVLEDAGPQMVNGWASSLNKGAPDEDGQELTFSLSNDNNSLFSIQPAIDTSGTLTYTPAANANGVALVSVVLSDNGGTANGGEDTFDTTIFRITIDPVNDKPSFSKGSDEYVWEDAGAQVINSWATALNKGALNEGDQVLSFSLSNDNNALFSVQPAIDTSGTLSYTPAADAHGVATVTVLLRDDGGTANGGEDAFDPDTFNITLHSVNDEPSFSKGEDQLVVEDAGLQIISNWATSLNKGAANESDQVLTFSLSNDNNALFSTQPTIDSSGTLRYTPASDAIGAAVVSVVLSDDGGTENGGDDTYDTQAFNISVRPVNNEPSFVKGADESVLEDAGPQIVNAWATSLDKGAGHESWQTLSFSLSNDNNELFSVQPAIDTTGTLTYEPAADAHGVATVSVILSDDGGTADGGDDTYDTQTFDIIVNAVNDEPSFVMSKDADQNIWEDAGAQVLNNWASSLDKGASNESGQSLTFTLSNDNNSLFSVQPAIDSSGTLTYTPAADAVGSAAVSVELSDDGGTVNGGDDTYALQTFGITVDPVNDEPSFVKGADESVLEDAGLQVVSDWATQLEKGAAHESAQTLSFTLTNDNNGLFSTQPAIDSSGTLRYTPAADAHGLAIVTVILRDDGGTENGGDDTYEPQTFSITVQPVNDEPSFILGEDENVLEDAGPQTIVSWAKSLDKGAPNESSQSLTFTLSNDNNGLFSVQPAIDSSGTLTYTPTEGAIGTAIVSVGVSDDGGTENGGDDTYEIQAFTITVHPVNNEPSFVKGADESVLEDAGPQVLSAWASSLDKGAANESGQTLSFTLSNDNNTLFSVQPGIDTSGTLTYTPAVDAYGIATVTVILRDDGGTENGGDDTSEPQTFNITVQPVNDEPSFIIGEDESVLEDAGLQTLAFWASALDKGASNESSQSLIFSLSNDNSSLFSVQPAIDSSGTLTYTPAEDAIGTAVVSVELSDDGGTENGGDDTYEIQAFTITVHPVNNEPSFVKGADESVLEDAGPQVLSAWASSLDKGAEHESGQSLSFSLSNDNPDLFSVQPSIDTSGTLTYTPAVNAYGEATVTVILRDDGGTENGGDDSSEPQTFNITVQSVNDEPSFVKGADQNILEDAGLQVVNGWATSLNKGAVNEGDQLLNFTVTNDNESLFSTQPAIDSEGSLTFMTATDAHGIATVSVLLSDDGGTADGGIDSFTPQTFSIVVHSVNDEPSFSMEGDQSVLEDAGPQTVSSWASALNTGAADESGQNLTFTLTNDHEELFSVQPSIDFRGTLSYTPAEDVYGQAILSVSLKDDGGTVNGGDDSFAPQTFRINILPVNDPPSFELLSDPHQTIMEDAGTQEVSAFAKAIDAGGGIYEASQLLSFQITTSNDSLFEELPQIDPVTGDLTYTPAPDANGRATIGVSLSDNGGGTDSSEEQSFTVQVTEVNDIPTFSLRQDSLILQQSEGAQVIPEFITDISPGGAQDEASQTLTFILGQTGIEGNMFFEGIPTITSEGVLTFELSPESSGMANFVVSLRDNGLPRETSGSKPFTIRVIPLPNSAPSLLNPVLDRLLYVDFGSISVDLTNVFQDADGDSLSFSVSSSDTSVVQVSLSGQSLTLTEVGNGRAEITITAHDGFGHRVDHRFMVTVDFVLSKGSHIADQLHIFPNPSTDQVSIKGIPEKAQAIWVSDMLGKQVSLEVSTRGSTWYLGVKELIPGTYILNILIDKQVISRKLIKK